MSDTVVVPRSFKLLEEIEQGEKGTGIEQAHSGFISYGMKDPTDITLTFFTCSIIGPQGASSSRRCSRSGRLFVLTLPFSNRLAQTNLGDRIYTVEAMCGQNYPQQPCRVFFREKIDMDGVNQKTGEVNVTSVLGGWNSNKSIAQVLVALRRRMTVAAKKSQPSASSLFPEPSYN